MAPKAKPKYARGRRVCVFCEGSSGVRITKEHVFGEWLEKFFPRDETTTHTRIDIEWPDEIGSQPAVEKFSKGQGHVGSKRVRVLCDHCNNVLLSGLESRVRETLPPLIIGRSARLLPSAQSLFSTWAAKTAMIAEYLKPIDSGISQDDRSWLLKNMTPPPEKWFVWIGAYSGNDWGSLSIYQSRMGIGSTAVRRPSDAPEYAQATTFGVGHVLFCVVSSSSPLINRFTNQESEGLLQIWPPRQRSLLWPTRRTLNDKDATAVSNIIEHSGIFDDRFDPGSGWRFVGF